MRRRGGDTVSSQIRKQRDTVVSPVKAHKAYQEAESDVGEPEFYADIEFRDVTSDGLLRASSFKGLYKGTGRS
jgi:bifunctional non-homologous end joining protein LigD